MLRRWDVDVVIVPFAPTGDEVHLTIPCAAPEMGGVRKIDSETED